jgi:hypothetical protein
MKVKPPKPPKPAVRIFQDVPKLWPGGTVVCIAGGPSLTVEDVNYVRGKVDGVIGINDAYRIAPWIDVLYACDARWWDHHKGVPSLNVPKYSLQRQSAKWRGVSVLQNTGTDGLQMKPNGLKTGKNSGYQAINLAVHLGAVRILLLGYDMEIKIGGKAHWFGSHPWGGQPPVSSFRGMFRTLVAPLAKHGVTVINCSRSTSLDAFPCMALELALPAVEALEVA